MLCFDPPGNLRPSEEAAEPQSDPRYQTPSGANSGENQLHLLAAEAWGWVPETVMPVEAVREFWMNDLIPAGFASELSRHADECIGCT